MRKVFITLILWSSLVFAGSINCDAEEIETNYEVLVEDEADLLTEEQESSLYNEMEKIAEYGNVAFVSIAQNSTSAEYFARRFYMDRFGTESGTVFLIDMYNHMIWIHSDGAIYKVITTSYANTITDNVYRYATREEYYECAKEAFGQIYTLLEGDRIAQPMKYISNALLALILALFINFGVVCYFARLKRPSDAQLFRNMEKHFTYTKPTAVFSHKTKVYDPIESSGGSSGGGSRRSSGGSSGGGSRSSGGGGGHRF